MCRKQGRILEKENCQIFNTGLMDKTRNYIYACFTPNSKSVKHPPWICNGFGTIGGDSKVSCFICSNIDENLKDALLPYDKFDPMLPINIDNYEHCMIENALRIPRCVIERAFSGKDVIMFLDEVMNVDSFINLRKLAKSKIGEEFTEVLVCRIFDKSGIITDVKMGKMKQGIIGAYLRRLSGYENGLCNLKRCLDDAIRASEEVIKEYPSLAVPEYYPRDDSFGTFFLPITFCDSHECLALVVIKDEQRPCYIGKTILTREMALKDALLLQSDIPQWLRNDNKE